MGERPARVAGAAHSRRRVLPRALLPAVLAAAMAGGCGGGERDGASASGASPVDAGPPPPTLRAGDVPYLDSRRRVLRAADLAREAALPALTGRLGAWGFEAGASRSFQGQSRRLQVVESRTLRFRSPAGAASFLAFVRAHRGSFFAGSGAPRPFASRGRHGLLLESAPCACHLATPAYLGVVARGSRVSWLAVNGPRASVRALRTLAARAP
jgi:hypothetical protein